MTLVVKNLKVRANDKKILKGVSLEIKSGQVQAMLGLNGSKI